MKPILLHTISSLLASIGSTWVIFEVSDHFSGKSNYLPAWLFIVMIILGTICWTLYQGIWGIGFLRRSITLGSNSFDSKITIRFGDLFKQSGWVVIPVNDFFDSVVDNGHVSVQSLHGQMLTQFLGGGNTADWDGQVEEENQNSQLEIVERASGKKKRFPIGTTVKTTINANQFLCVALTVTDIENLEVRATIEDLLLATKQMLTKARSVCAGTPLSIPIMGSGLSRTGIKPNILLHLLLLSIFEETKKSKITQDIQIIISNVYSQDINLLALKNDWGY